MNGDLNGDTVCPVCLQNEMNEPWKTALFSKGTVTTTGVARIIKKWIFTLKKKKKRHDPEREPFPCDCPLPRLRLHLPNASLAPDRLQYTNPVAGRRTAAFRPASASVGVSTIRKSSFCLFRINVTVTALVEKNTTVEGKQLLCSTEKHVNQLTNWMTISIKKDDKVAHMVFYFENPWQDMTFVLSLVCFDADRPAKCGSDFHIHTSQRSKVPAHYCGTTNLGESRFLRGRLWESAGSC